MESDVFETSSLINDFTPLGTPKVSRETTPFSPLHTWGDGRYRWKERVTLPPVRERSVSHAGQGSPLSLRRACPHSTLFHLHGLDLAWSLALNSHGRGRVAGTADGRERAAHGEDEGTVWRLQQEGPPCPPRVVTCSLQSYFLCLDTVQVI
jgi:hypothetical protein